MIPSRLPPAQLDDEMARWPAGLSAAEDRWKLTMSVYSVTLGVKCDYCHVPGDWKRADKAPMKLVARMNAMFEEFPKYMPPTARTQCWMCHKGVTKPETEPAAKEAPQHFWRAGRIIAEPPRSNQSAGAAS